MIELIIIFSIFTLGLYTAASDGFILAPVKHFIAHNILGGHQYIRDKDEGYEFSPAWIENIWKPILGCPICMVSFWGIILYTLLCGYSIESIYELPIIIISSCGINFIVFKNLMEEYL